MRSSFQDATKIWHLILAVSHYSISAFVVLKRLEWAFVIGQICECNNPCRMVRIVFWQFQATNSSLAVDVDLEAEL